MKAGSTERDDGSGARAGRLSVDPLVAALKAVAEPTRLRIVSVLSRVELSVGDICAVVGQSQPRVSRHLKILVDARLLDRHAQGTSAFYRLTADAPGRTLAEAVLAMLETSEGACERDLVRAEAIRQRRAEEAAAYFEQVAPRWNELRALHVEDSQIEKAVLDAVGDARVSRMLDVGTGTGRMLSLFADRIDEGVGIDSSQQMLNLARSNLDDAGAANCRVLQCDVYDIDLPRASFDVALLHQVLHFLDDPGSAIAEAARTLRSGGRLVVVDFAPHDLESLRFEHRHRRLGFSDDEVARWIAAVGLDVDSIIHLTPNRTDETGRCLTTTIWTATMPSVDLAPGAVAADSSHMEEAS